MAIEKITKEEFDGLKLSNTRRSPETKAVEALAMGEGLKITCRWSHSKSEQCSGRSIINHAAKRKGQSISATCRDGFLYVLRVE